GSGSDSDMDRRLSENDALLVLEMRIDARVVRQDLDDATDEEWQQSEPRVALPLIEILSQGFERGHVDFLDISKMRNSPFRRLHRLGDLASEPDYANFFAAVACGRHLMRLSSAVAKQKTIEIFMEYPPLWPGSRDLSEIDIERLRSGADGRGGGRPLPRGSLCCALLRQLGRTCGRCNRGSGSRWKGSLVLCLGVNNDELVADRSLVTGGAISRQHLAGDRRGDLDRRLVGHHVDKR